MRGKRNRLIWKIVAFLVAIIFVLAIVLPAIVSAGELDKELNDKQRELERLKQRIEETKQGLKVTEEKRKSVLSKLTVIEQDLEKTRAELEKLEEELAAAEERVARVTRELEETRERLEQRRQLLQSRVRFLYEHGTVGYLEVLLGARDFRDFLQRFDLVRRIVEQDVELFRHVTREKEFYTEKKKRLEEARAELAQLKQETEAKKAEIAAQKTSHERLLARIQNDKEAYERALAEYEELSEKLIKVIQQLQAQYRRQSQGKLDFLWPADGPITSYFGRRYHPILKKYRGHAGIDIGAPWGSTVRAAEAGMVIYSGWLGGYGKTVIIDHGGGISTLYGHNSKLLVTVGQEVTRGQHIANVGSTGLSTGPHTHFEVRVDGTPVNPLGWL